MARFKYLKIYLCGLCHHCGRKETGIRGCNFNGKFLAFEDQEDFADIPNWCPLPDAPEKGNQKLQPITSAKSSAIAPAKHICPTHKIAMDKLRASGEYFCSQCNHEAAGANVV